MSEQQESTSGRQRPGRITVSRDTLSFVGGWYLMIFQAQFASQFNLSVFVGGMIITGVPGVIQAATLLLGRTPEPPGSSPEPASSPAQ